MEAILPEATQQLLSTGLVGAFCVFLIWVVGRREQELKDARLSFQTSLAEKDKLILELQESRLVELKLILESINANSAALMANKVAIEAHVPMLQKILESLAFYAGKQ